MDSAELYTVAVDLSSVIFDTTELCTYKCLLLAYFTQAIVSDSTITLYDVKVNNVTSEGILFRSHGLNATLISIENSILKTGNLCNGI